jgi:uncharacterized membrane protein
MSGDSRNSSWRDWERHIQSGIILAVGAIMAWVATEIGENNEQLARLEVKVANLETQLARAAIVDQTDLLLRDQRIERIERDLDAVNDRLERAEITERP